MTWKRTPDLYLMNVQESLDIHLHLHLQIMGTCQATKVLYSPIYYYNLYGANLLLLFFPFFL